MDQKSKPAPPPKGQLVAPRPAVPQRAAATSATTVERYIRRWLGALIDLADRTANRMFNLPLK